MFFRFPCILCRWISLPLYSNLSLSITVYSDSDNVLDFIFIRRHLPERLLIFISGKKSRYTSKTNKRDKSINLFASLLRNLCFWPIRDNQQKDSYFLAADITLDSCAFPIEKLLSLLLHGPANSEFLLEDMKNLHNFYNKLICKELLGPQLLNSVLECMFLAFLKILFQNHHFIWVFGFRNGDQKEYCLLSHWLIQRQQKWHAYLFQFLISCLFDMIGGKNALHHIFIAYFRQNRLVFFQSKHILGYNQAVCQQQGRYFVSFLRVSMWRRQDDEAHHNLLGLTISYSS